MEAVITRVVVEPGTEADWEAAMHERMSAAEGADGWIGGSVLTPEDDPGARVILGLWESRDAWERWHRDPAFRETTEQLDALERDAGTATWHDVVYGRGRLQA